MRWAEQRSCGGRPQDTTSPHLPATYQCHRLRKISKSIADLRPTAPHSGYQLAPYVQSQTTVPRKKHEVLTRQVHKSTTRKKLALWRGQGTYGQELQSPRDPPIQGRPTAKELTNRPMVTRRIVSSHRPLRPNPQGSPRAHTPLETAAGVSGPQGGWTGGGARPGAGPRFPQ